MIEILIYYLFKITFVILLCLPLVYWYLTRKFNYWSKQGVNGPKPLPLFGNFLDRAKNNIAINDLKYMKEFGTVYGTFDGTEPVLQIAEPELIKQILVKDFNKFINRRELRTEHPIVNKNLFFYRSDGWKKCRIIASTAFTSGKIKRLYGLVRNCLQNYLDHLGKVAEKGESLCVKNMNGSFTLDVIAGGAFALKVNSLIDPNNPFLVKVREFFIMSPWRYIPAFVFPKFLNNLLGIDSSFSPQANEYIINLAKLMIKERKQSKEKYNDFLQLLIDANEDDHKKGDTTEGLESHFLNEDELDLTIQNKIVANKYLTEEEVMAQCWVFIVAGYETTATTLGFMSYAMAVNPECQEKLYKELVSAMGSDQEISYEDLHRLPYLDACVSETLRMYTPLTRLDREAEEDLILGDSGIRLYKGQLVEIPIYAIHHSEKFYKNPNQYIPERFLKENRDEIIPYTFMPFGTGPRHCIGMRFALMEVKLAMAHIILRYRFVETNKTEKEFVLLPLTSLLTPLSVTVGVEKRNFESTVDSTRL